MISGFINLYKESGITSQKAVSRLKGILRSQGVDFGKIGHLGTLDPDGEGVLPVAIGRATRLFDYFLHKKKVYYSEFVFGSTTNTLDASGTVTKESATVPAKADILRAIPHFIGKLSQMPPAYSAKSVGGVRAYALARKGETPNLTPKEVDIYSIVLKDELEYGVYSFLIECGGGTYIRAIARDLAKECGTLGYMRYIKRVENGIFSIKDSKKLEELEQGVLPFIIPLEEVLAIYPRLDVHGKDGERVLNGVPVKLDDMPQEGIFTVFINDMLCGLAEGNADSMLKIKTRLM